jgi:RND family efflux transporter MFP subunit
MTNPQSSIANRPGGRSPSRGKFSRVAQVSLFAAFLSPVPFLSGCGRSHTPASGTAPQLPTATVRIETVQRRALPTTEEVVGTVQSRHAVDIAAKISGRILELPVVLGQTVEEGDLVVAMDSQEIQARLEQTEIALRQAETDHRRVESLLGTGAATPSEFDTSNSRLHSARAAVAESKALLGHARITAPLRGVVARRNVDPGDLAMPGQLLLRLEDPVNLRLEADVPGSLLERVPADATLEVRVTGVPEPIPGRVTEIAPVADPATRSLRVKLELPPTPGLRSGQFGRVAIPLAETQTLVVPPTSIVARGQLDIVFVVAQDQARMRIVRPGRVRPEGIEILAGLEAGERIVVEDPAGLTDGQPLLAR